MFTHYRTQGIIFKKTDRGEADQLLTIYTKDFGKVDVLAKAVRKISSKLRSSAQLFYLSEIEFVQGKAHKTLTDAILIDKFRNLRNDLPRLKIAYRISDDFDSLIKGQERDTKIWHLLKESFEKLDSLKKPEIIYPYFFWNFVSLLGYAPEISDCTMQGKKIDCDIVKIIKVILRKDWHLLSRLKLEQEHLKLLKELAKWYRVKINI